MYAVPTHGESRCQEARMLFPLSKDSLALLDRPGSDLHVVDDAARRVERAVLAFHGADGLRASHAVDAVITTVTQPAPDLLLRSHGDDLGVVVAHSVFSHDCSPRDASERHHNVPLPPRD